MSATSGEGLGAGLTEGLRRCRASSCGGGENVGKHGHGGGKEAFKPARATEPLHDPLSSSGRLDGRFSCRY